MNGYGHVRWRRLRGMNGYGDGLDFAAFMRDAPRIMIHSFPYICLDIC